MARLVVVAPGARSMVQDLGFQGARGQGVPPGGVLDRRALRLVNALLGNAPGVEALEIALAGPRLRVEDGPVRIALDGGVEGQIEGGREVPSWTATTLQPGEVLRLLPPAGGGTALIGVAGGFDLPRLLGSRATCIKAGFGGLDGRCLQAGDVLTVLDAGPFPQADHGFATPPSLPDGPLRVVRGPQSEWFDAAWQAFLDGAYVVTPKFDRMGMRLDGTKLAFAAGKSGDIISDGACPGAIQVPGNGQPIILLADAQTTGGYPKIATVIRTDLPRLARMVAGDEIRFAAVTVDEAEAAARKDEAAIAALIAGIGPVQQGFDAAALASGNLISGAVDMHRADHFPGHLEDPKG